jgi:hypothetical protein
MPKVFNRYHRTASADAIYVGRPTKWGNPYTHQADKATLAEYIVASREEAVAMYRQYIMANPLLLKACQEELKGKDLVCFCAPKACHADILIEIANQTPKETS